MRAAPRLVLALAALALAGGCGVADPAGAAAGPGTSAAESSPQPTEQTSEQPSEESPSAEGSAEGGGPSAAPTAPPVDPAAAADAAAGVLARQVPDVGAGTFTVVPGSQPAGEGRLRTVRVEVEDGLPADGAAFAAFALQTLNDPRGWPGEGWAFARTDGPADVVLTLASPRTSAELCRPLDTRGTLSCRNGERAVLTWYRWVNGHEDYGSDLTGYRQYVVNHEVGHALGHGHVSCPGEGQLAPVMMQQTKGVLPCAPNPWPYP